MRIQRPARPSLRKLSAAYEAETIALWEQRAGRRLSREDAREIVENVTGFFQVLQEWDRAERMAASLGTKDS
jgi:hypothetical protein